MATYTLISSNVLTGTAASVTFSAIPATYTDLVLRVSTRSDRSATRDSYKIRFNGDTGASTLYSYTQLYGDGSSAGSVRNSSYDNIGEQLTTAATGTSNTFNSAEIYIPSYTVSQSKPIGSFNVQEYNSAGTSEIAPYASLYRSNSAISSITLTLSTGPNFVATSSFYLYGISNA
jgi:hypothetical protein